MLLSPTIVSFALCIALGLEGTQAEDASNAPPWSIDKTGVLHLHGKHLYSASEKNQLREQLASTARFLARQAGRCLSLPLDTPGRDMTNKYYNKCTDAELICHIRARNLRTALVGPLVRHRLIQSLKRNDACNRPTPLHFFDLASELRTKVYEQLLLLKPKLDEKDARVHRCHPEILATCSKIHCEANSVLYGCNLFEVDFGTIHDVWSAYAVSVSCAGFEQHVKIQLPSRQISVSAWPEYLLRMRKLKLRVASRARIPSAVDRDDVSNNLFSFAYFLRASSALQELVVAGDVETQHNSDSGGPSTAQAEHLLRPLHRLIANFDWIFGDFRAAPQLPGMLRIVRALHDEISASQMCDRPIGQRKQNMLAYINRHWLSHVTGGLAVEGSSAQYLARVADSLDCAHTPSKLLCCRLSGLGHCVAAEARRTGIQASAAADLRLEETIPAWLFDG